MPLDSTPVTLPLTRGYCTIVDADVADSLRGIKLWANKPVEHHVEACLLKDGKAEKLHRHILGLSRGDGVITDHINGNSLDNRRANLRACDATGNAMNCAIHRNNKSGRKGVSWDRGAWRAQIQVARKVYHLGRFADIEDAARAYQEASVRMHGEYARPLG